jgi:hypothetical protein
MPRVRYSLGERLLTALLLSAWLLPGVLGLAVAIHLELHHDAHGVPPDRALALAAEHGHSHGLAEPAHDHPAARAKAQAAAKEPAAAFVLPWGGLPAPRETTVETAPSAPLRPPPRPLFTLHCALLS